MHAKLTLVEVANKFISKRNITDPDLIQDIYVLALECADASTDTQKFYSKALYKSCHMKKPTEIPWGTFQPYCINRKKFSNSTIEALQDVFGDRNCDIIIMFFNERVSLREIAKTYNITETRVRIILEESLRKIRNRPVTLRKVINSLSASSVEDYEGKGLYLWINH